MARRNRNTLKNYFEKGARPSDTDFHDLVDSCLNINDDGFDRTPENGVEISTIEGNEGLIGLYRHRKEGDRPLWSFHFDTNSDKLLISHADSKAAVLTLCPDGRIGVNHHNTPAYELDVRGTIAAATRVGTYATGTIPADGEWWDITETLVGCHVLEVVAGAGGRKREGRYAVLHAIAANAYNPQGFFFNFLRRKNRIRYTQSFYRSGADKLRLRWTEKEDNYVLQAKSNSPYETNGAERDGDDPYPYQIQYTITRLWCDQTMDKSRFEGKQTEK